MAILALLDHLDQRVKDTQDQWWVYKYCSTIHHRFYTSISHVKIFVFCRVLPDYQVCLESLDLRALASQGQRYTTAHFTRVFWKELCNVGLQFSLMYLLQGDVGFRGLPGLPGPPGEGIQGPPVSKLMINFTFCFCTSGAGSFCSLGYQNKKYSHMCLILL